MSAEDRIDYRGPDLVHKPEVGSNVPAVKDAYRTPRQRSYANPNLLDQMLNFLLAETSRMTAELEEELLKYAVPIPRADRRLTEAHHAEWPSALGTPGNRITYRYYRALAARPTTAASYVRQRFEDGIRDYTGTDALDVITLVQIISDEARLIKDFVATYIGRVDDTSEFRLIELFQDWGSAAINHLEDLKRVRKTVGLNLVPSAEVSFTTSAEARQAQAIFKVKLNTVNKDIADNIAYLKKNFSEHAATFYGRFLGPAMQWRLSAGRAFHTQAGVLGTELTVTGNALDANLSVLQSDQLRRNMLFSAKVQEIAGQVQRQDAYRDYIHQLAPQGKTIAPGQADAAVQIDEDPEEVGYWEDVDADYLGEEAFFDSLHSSLGGIGDPAAHPQYLLKAGDILAGNLELAEGVLIDGMDPSHHQHTGADGTRKVLGTHIEGGTVPPTVIDRTVVPPVPTGLRIVEQSVRLVPPGMSVIDVQIAWQGDIDLQYEVQQTVL